MFYMGSPFPKQALVFTCLQYKSFENNVGKGEIARNEQFLLFPTVFSTHLENFLPFPSNLKLLSTNSFNLEDTKICRLGKGLYCEIFQNLLVTNHKNSSCQF